jgi:hypothetical protein
MAAEGPKVPDCAVLRQTSHLTNAIPGALEPSLQGARSQTIVRGSSGASGAAAYCVYPAFCPACSISWDGTRQPVGG